MTDLQILQWCRQHHTSPAQILPRYIVRKIKCRECGAMPLEKCNGARYPGHKRTSNHMGRVLDAIRSNLSNTGYFNE